jgi:oxaloacetate decarboxylase alpha subunit
MTTPRHIPIVDETLRDGHQCLWSTRMTNEMMLPIAARMDRVGFDSIDLIGGAVWDVSVRFLREDPWERIRDCDSLRTPLNASCAGRACGRSRSSRTTSSSSRSSA